MLEGVGVGGRRDGVRGRWPQWRPCKDVRGI